jgi:hypothetical protein
MIPPGQPLLGNLPRICLEPPNGIPKTFTILSPAPVGLSLVNDLFCHEGQHTPGAS